MRVQAAHLHEPLRAQPGGIFGCRKRQQHVCCCCFRARILVVVVVGTHIHVGLNRHGQQVDQVDLFTVQRSPLQQPAELLEEILQRELPVGPR